MKTSNFAFLFTLIFLAFFSTKSFATHIRAGEITYVQLDELTIEITITTYTKESSNHADQTELNVDWGDGNSEIVFRQNGPGNPPEGESLDFDNKKNIFKQIHSYPGTGHYVISIFDENRNGDILNINFGDSYLIPFFIQSTVTLFSQQFNGFNNSPILLQPPIDVGCIGQTFIHNPNAYDVDGDSLSYDFAIPMSSKNTPVPNYIFPNQVGSNHNNSFTINKETGEIRWENPQQQGEYNIAMYIIEYRHGLPIDTMIRDMQILIKDCNNTPPIITTNNEFCVVAGNEITWDVYADDPDVPKQKVKLTAKGGPFVVDNPATFNAPLDFDSTVVHGIFSWNTNCDNISKEPYAVVFKAEDTGNDPHLADLETVRIKVIGPPPIHVNTEVINQEIKVTWDAPYICINDLNEYFRYFSIWRKKNSNNFAIDSCETGLDGRGYTQIGTSIDIEDNLYFFNDQNVERGHTYCYRVLAHFAKLSAGGYPYNIVESMPSNESCRQIGKDIPLLTHIDVKETDSNTGKIFIKWTKPVAADLDTTTNLPPYRYVLERSLGIGTSNFSPVIGADFSYDNYASANDTSFLDANLDTDNQAYTYKIGFYSAGKLIGFSTMGSSTFLTVSPSDQFNNLTWDFQVPFANTNFLIYRKDPNLSNFNKIGETTQTSYMDEHLTNGDEYCYYIECNGAYDPTIDHFINNSQKTCATPIDNISPCPPVLSVTNFCNDNSIIENDIWVNHLKWSDPADSCLYSTDIESFLIYFSDSEGNTPELIEETPANVFSFDHIRNSNIAGCYYIIALDKNGNQSIAGNTICVDNCPIYELPNTFTPNNDNQNDFFSPRRKRFINHIHIIITNRWGATVFETNDPDINWDGKNQQGSDLAEGTYFYTCQVFEQRVEGIIESEKVITGFIELLRSN